MASSSFQNSNSVNATPISLLTHQIPSFSPKSIPLQSQSIRSDMKDISTAAIRHSRNSLVYPKKRPSPHGGVVKSQKSPLLPSNAPARRSPRSAKTAILQRQREAQILALRREGVLLEEEYRDEIQFYMHEMEVCLTCLSPEPNLV